MATRKQSGKPKHGSAVAAAVTDVIPMTYQLGPQDDGSYILRVADDSMLMTAITAFQKQKKNAIAAVGTMAALKPGMSDPLIAIVQRELDALVASFTGARTAENQIADTPIGKALAEATHAAQRGETGEPVDGSTDGSVWSPSVPRPRPEVGQYIRHPAGAAVSIATIDGYSEEMGAFSVRDTSDRAYVVFSHAPQPGALEWRLMGEPYPTPRIIAPDLVDAEHDETPARNPTAAADELIAATEDSDALLHDAPAPDGDEDEDDYADSFADSADSEVESATGHDGFSGEPIAGSEGAPMPGADVIGKESDASNASNAGNVGDESPPTAKKSSKKAAKSAVSANSQRERNQRNAGIKPTPKKGGKGGKK